MMEMFRVDQLRKCPEFPLNFCGSIFSRVTGAISCSGVLYFPRLVFLDLSNNALG